MRKFKIVTVALMSMALSGIGLAAVSAATTQLRSPGPLCFQGHKVIYSAVCPKGWHHVNVQRGAAGPAGKNGTNGTNGTNGLNGAVGATGVAGVKGATGSQGPAGVAGAKGATGSQGPAGVAGAKGATGSQGPAGVAPTSPILYSSLISPLPLDWWSLSFDGTSTTKLGNKISLTSSAKLANVVVALDSQACESGSGATCVTTPGATFLLPVTLAIYNPGTSAGTVGSEIAVDTQTFAIPYRPTASPTACAAGTASIFTPFSNDGTQWFDAATGSCYYGITDAITFNDFVTSGRRRLHCRVAEYRCLRHLVFNGNGSGAVAERSAVNRSTERQGCSRIGHRSRQSVHQHNR